MTNPVACARVLCLGRACFAVHENKLNYFDDVTLFQFFHSCFTALFITPNLAHMRSFIRIRTALQTRKNPKLPRQLWDWYLMRLDVQIKDGVPRTKFSTTLDLDSFRAPNVISYPLSVLLLQRTGNLMTK